MTNLVLSLHILYTLSAGRSLISIATEAAKRECRYKLLQLAQAEFPDGNIPISHLKRSDHIPSYLSTRKSLITSPKPLSVNAAASALAQAALFDDVPMPYLLVPATHFDFIDLRFPLYTADDIVVDEFDDTWRLREIRVHIALRY